MYDAQTTERLLKVAQQLSHLLLRLRRLAPQTLSDTSDEYPGNRQQYQYEKCQVRTHGEHRDQENDDVERLPEGGLQRIHDGPLHLLHIVGDACHDVALALFGEVADRQGQYFRIHFAADIAHHAVADRGEVIHSQVAGRVFQQEEDDDQQTDQRQGFELSVLDYKITQVIIEIIQQYFDRGGPWL